MAVEKVSQPDKARARQLLVWLRTLEDGAGVHREPVGVMAMLGFARRFRSKPRTTAEWIAELRAGERE